MPRQRWQSSAAATAGWRRTCRTLARNVAPAAPDDLRLWHAAGQLRAVRAHDATVGLLAIAPGALEWIEGDEVKEEAVEAAHNGQGYAASAQAAWAAGVASDPERLLVGTIDRLNVASRKTAERAGRDRVLDEVFVSLPACSRRGVRPPKSPARPRAART